jgi:UDP-perosamine 4-acetyltransferase
MSGFDRPLILLGGGGHARVLLATIARLGGSVTATLTEGVDEMLAHHHPRSVLLVNGIGSLGPGSRRRQIFSDLRAKGYDFASLVDPHAVVAPDVELGEGAQIMAGAVIQPGCAIGANAIVNTRAAVDHDCRLGDHVHVAPGVTLSGGVTVEADSHIGTGATIIQGIRIGAGAMVAAGAVVVKDVAPGITVMGVPAKEQGS